MASVTKSDVVVEVVKTSEWGSGFEGQFRITNNNAYDVLNWTLDFRCPEDFTWFSEGDIVPGPGRAKKTLVPKEWTKVVKAKSTLVMGFGGKTTPPTDLRFVQSLPLVGVDPTLETRGRWGGKVLAPYVDACAYPTPNLNAMAGGSWNNFFTLAFVVAGRDKKAAWGGTVPLDSQYFLDQIRKLRAAGGEVSISFGGANGIELAQAIQDVDELVAAYSSVIDLYSLTRVDMDIEGGAVADRASVDRRNKALAQLQKLYPGLQITYCLPVLPTGLTADGVALIENAFKNKVKVAGFHGMAMGESRKWAQSHVLPLTLIASMCVRGGSPVAPCCSPVGPERV